MTVSTKRYAPPRKPKPEPDGIWTDYGMSKAEWKAFAPPDEKPPQMPWEVEAAADKAKRRQAQRERRQVRDGILKTRVAGKLDPADEREQHKALQSLLTNQSQLWDECVKLITRTGYNSHLGSSYFSLTSDFLHREIAAWRAAEAFPWLMDMSVAQVRWIVLVFSKKAHRLARHLTPADCPPCTKFCQGVSLAVEDHEQSAVVTIPKLGRIEVMIHHDSPKTWDDAAHHVTGAVIAKETRKGKPTRWVVKLIFGKEAAADGNRTPFKQKGFITKVTEAAKDLIWRDKQICRRTMKQVLEQLRDELSLRLSRSTVYRVLTEIQASVSYCV